MKKYLLFFLLLSFIVFISPIKGMAANPLQTMIDSLEEGAVLQLEDKTYEGNIVITKPVKIVGSKNTVIKGDGDGNVISIKASGVTIQNLTVTNGSMNRNSSEEYAAIKIYNDKNVIDGVTVRDSWHGIYLSQSHENIIKNCFVTGKGKGEIANQGNGLHIYYSNNNVLENNVVTGTRDGMYFDYANGNEIMGNRLSETRYGLHFMYSHDNSFSSNVFTFNTGGAAVMESYRNKLYNNQFVFNYGHQSFGILLLSANDTTIENNLFSLNQRGLYIDQSTNNMIRNNQILKNQIGVELWASSNEQVFTLNTIDENTVPVFTLGGQGRNVWHENGKGNNWGDSFPILDLNQDGIGDESVTYQSSLARLIEDQELTYLFLKSPAIAIYEKFNQFFNKQETMFEDPAPLIRKESHSIQWLWIGLAGILLIPIILKRGKWLCIIFGRNGRKI